MKTNRTRTRWDATRGSEGRIVFREASLASRPITTTRGSLGIANSGEHFQGLCPPVYTAVAKATFFLRQVLPRSRSCYAARMTDAKPVSEASSAGAHRPHQGCGRALLALMIGSAIGFVAGRTSLERQWSTPPRTLTQKPTRRAHPRTARTTPKANTRVLGAMPIGRARLALAAMTVGDPAIATVASIGAGNDGFGAARRHREPRTLQDLVCVRRRVWLQRARRPTGRRPTRTA